MLKCSCLPQAQPYSSSALFALCFPSGQALLVWHPGSGVSSQFLFPSWQLLFFFLDFLYVITSLGILIWSHALILRILPPPAFTGSPHTHGVSQRMSWEWGPTRGLSDIRLISSYPFLVYMFVYQVAAQHQSLPGPSVISPGSSLALHNSVFQALLPTSPCFSLVPQARGTDTYRWYAQTFTVLKQNKCL